MSRPLLLKNGRIIDPVNNVDRIGDLLVAAGKCQTVVDSLPADTVELDLTGKWLLPGLIDIHVHLREPGEEYKETIASGMAAAAAGGFTAVACMPNTNPPLDSETAIAFVRQRAQLSKGARVYPVGAISRGSKGQELADMGEMRRAGAVAFSDDGHPVTDSQLMRRALEYASNYNCPIISHSEELSLSRNGAMNEGAFATRLGLRGIPGAAEEIMVYRDLTLAAYTGQRLHLAHISTAESVALIRRAKAAGCPVTAETTPHYFSLIEEAVGRYDTNAKMNPPLRTAADVEAVKEGLRDGTLDAIATDHAPHSELEKEVEFAQAANGIIGLETSLPLALSLLREGLIDERRLVELMSVNPARIIGVEGGSLAAGQRADITVVDPALDFFYKRQDIVSKSKNSPFIGRRFTGRAVLTIVEGEIVYSTDKRITTD